MMKGSIIIAYLRLSPHKSPRAESLLMTTIDEAHNSSVMLRAISTANFFRHRAFHRDCRRPLCAEIELHNYLIKKFSIFFVLLPSKLIDHKKHIKKFRSLKKFRLPSSSFLKRLCLLLFLSSTQPHRRGEKESSLPHNFSFFPHLLIDDRKKSIDSHRMN